MGEARVKAVYRFFSASWLSGARGLQRLPVIVIISLNTLHFHTSRSNRRSPRQTRPSTCTGSGHCTRRSGRRRAPWPSSRRPPSARGSSSACLAFPARWGRPADPSACRRSGKAHQDSDGAPPGTTFPARSRSWRATLR